MLFSLLTTILWCNNRIYIGTLPIHYMETGSKIIICAQLSASKQTAVLLQQDKEFFSKQATELQNRLLHSDDRLTQVTENLERTKQAREELYDKYVTSRYVLEIGKSIRIVIPQDL